MQPYMIFGLGFSAEFLTDDEFDNIKNQDDNPNGLNLASFTERNSVVKDWSCVVVKRLNMTPNTGKMVTYNQIKQVLAKEVIMDISTTEYIMAELKKYKIEHLFDNVEPIIYSVCA